LYYNEGVRSARPTVVQARLSPAEQHIIKELSSELGWSPSQIVREGIRLVRAAHVPGSKRIVGLGRFVSGVRDLASNKKHLEGFGR
jgi:hypothetical protein